MPFYSRTSGTGNGSQTDFTIGWDYIAVTDVKAAIDSTPTTAFSVVGDTVTFDDPVPNGIPYVIYRQTAIDVIQEFIRLGTPSSGGFNQVLKKIQFIAQELADGAGVSIDIGLAVDRAETAASNASTSASAAATSATTASTQASNASTSASAAASSATTASTQASNASTSASAAATSASNAATSASNASSSASAAATSATNAAASAASLTYATIAETLTGTATNRMVNPDDLAAIWEKGSDIASASAIHIPSTGGGYFVVTGTTTITSIVDDNTPHNGRMVRLRFSGALTFTHNATSLILPGSANITTAAGDVATVVTEDGTNWRCVAYNRADGTAVVSSSLSAATQAEQESASSTSVYVTPGRQQYHPGMVKAWVLATYSGGVPSITKSHNVTSVTDNGVGDITANFTTSFSSNDYCTITSARHTATKCFSGAISSPGPTSTGVRVLISSDAGAATDPTEVSIASMGDQ